MSFQVTALPSYGGITLCFAIGAVVVGVPTTCHTPLSGQRSPVRAVVPIGTLVSIILLCFSLFHGVFPLNGLAGDGRPDWKKLSSSEIFQYEPGSAAISP